MPRGNSAPPSPPTRKRYYTRLTSITAVRKELAKLYRAARSGDIRINDASRLAYILWLLARIHEGSELEDRIARLERVIEERQSSADET